MTHKTYEQGITDALEAISETPVGTYNKALNDTQSRPTTPDEHIDLAEMHGIETAYRAVESLK